MFELYNYNMVDAQTLQTFSILENKNEVMEAKKTTILCKIITVICL